LIRELVEMLEIEMPSIFDLKASLRCSPSEHS
jgi:hypothetical protein